MALLRKSGIYQILCLVSGKSYVGSSVHIFSRWKSHVNLLNKGLSPSPRLQQAWNKHGESNFAFSILEECTRARLFEREQFHIDAKKRDYNSMPKIRVFTDEMVAKRVAALRLNAANRTHCPKGHEYTTENTYIGKSKVNDKRCRQCNRERQADMRSVESPEHRAKRYKAMIECHHRNREARLARMRKYYFERKRSGVRSVFT